MKNIYSDRLYLSEFGRVKYRPLEFLQGVITLCPANRKKFRACERFDVIWGEAISIKCKCSERLILWDTEKRDYYVHTIEN